MNQSDPQTVGERLRVAREALNLSLAEAAATTSIRFNHLQELEDDHPEVLSSGVQARGFLRLYASFLNLDANELIALWNPQEVIESPEKSVTKKRVEQPANLDEPAQITSPESENEIVSDVLGETDLEEQQKLEKEPKKNFLDPLTRKVKALFARIPVPEKVKEIASKVKLPALLQKPKTAEETAPQETSQEIFKEIGAALRDHRLVMELSLADIEHFTNLKRMVLVAIEDGRFNDLPSTVQGRGMLNNYAKFLAMDDTAIMDRYARALLLQREERMPSRKPPEPAVSVKVNLPEGLRRVLNPDLVIGGALIVALFGFILWGASQMLASSGEKPTDAPSISQMLQLTPSVSPLPDLTQTAGAAQLSTESTAIPGVIISQSTPTPVATANAAPLQLYIIAHDRAFMRVAVDGISAFDGRVIPNNVYTYSGNDLITLLTGNGAALEVYFNQEYLGNLGSVGEVIDLRFSLQGLQTPTPRPQLTPTATVAGAEAAATPEGK
jgi:cytoskeletal protein RodZ